MTNSLVLNEALSIPSVIGKFAFSDKNPYQEITDLINQIGDIEHPIPLGIRMLKDVPEFRSIAKRAAKAVLWG